MSGMLSGAISGRGKSLLSLPRESFRTISGACMPMSELRLNSANILAPIRSMSLRILIFPGMNHLSHTYTATASTPMTFDSV